MSLLQETRTYCESLPQKGTATEDEARQKANKVEQSDNSDDSQTLHHMEVKGKSQPPYIVSVALDGRSTQIEVDTGATLSLMSETTYRKLWKVPAKLKPTTACLSTYFGQ